VKGKHKEVLRVLSNSLGELLHRNSQVTVEQLATRELSLKSHRAMFEAVRNMDKGQAPEAMRGHLRIVRKVLGSTDQTDVA